MENAAQKSEKILEKNLHEKFALYGKNAREWMEKCKLLLPEIVRREIWRKKGFSSIYEYAAKLAGMSRGVVDDALWVLKKAEDKPELKRVAEEKGINAIKPVISIVTAKTEKFWAEKAREMSKHALEAYVHELKKAHPEAKNNSDFLPGEFFSQNQKLFSEIKTETIQLEVNSRTADELRKLKGIGSWDELMQKFIELYKEKLEVEKPETVQTDSRYIPVKIERYALAKTGSTCAFPGCTKSYEILHHTARFSLTHAHNPDQLVPLCKAHEQLAHLGLIENEEASPNEWCLRKWPNETEEKYRIDQKVLKFRNAFG